VTLTGKRIEIAIVDDHRMFADSLSCLLSGLNPAYRCTSIDSPLRALEMIQAGSRFDLILSDLIMDRMNGIAFVKALRRRGCRMPVLIVSGINTAPPIEEALRLGAQGFIPKSASSDMLEEAIEAAFSGDIFLPPELWTSFEEGRPQMPGAVEDAIETEIRLSDRQLEVLQLIAEGYSNREAAATLGISENTIKTHLKQIFRLLNVKTRAACIRRSQQIGLIS
jgi:DNA-binding NarL/FixJ family response regulator